MRRDDKEIKNKKEIEYIIKSAKVCRVAFCDGNRPYILPFNFGYKNKCFYIHCAPEGRKLDIIRKNSNVCVEIDTAHELKEAGDACSHSFMYKSVIAEGKAVIEDSYKDKIKALELLMKQMTGKDFKKFSQGKVESIKIIKIKATKISGKKSGY